MAGIATIRGTAIAPGVSRNKRLYTKETLGRAVQRAQQRLSAGEPLTMLTHHGAEDDSTRIVGRVTALSQREDGSVAFEADIADTAHGRDIAALVTGDQPYLDGVSIRGAWLGKVRRVQHDGEMVETADELDLDGLDFTKTPGVPLARIEPDASPAETAAGGRHLVYESVTEASAAATKRPYGDVRYADTGYRDGVKRYPIDTVKHARAAWAYINQAKNARLYTAQQLKRIKGRIKAALKGFGVDVAAESATRFGEIAEFYDDMPGGQGGGFCIDAYNGPVSLTIRACDIDPAELRVIATAAMDAAVDALQALDPDMDADIDVPGAPHASTDGDEARRPDDNDMETAPAPDALTETSPAQPAGDTTESLEVPAVSEPQTPAAETATPTPVRTLTDADLTALGETFAAALAPLTAALAPAPAIETTTSPAEPVTETTAGEIGEQALREQMKALIPDLIAEYGLPPRRGVNTTETAATPPAPSTDELWASRADILLGGLQQDIPNQQ